MSVLIIGSVAFDTIKTPLARSKNILGGSASYSSVSASFFSPVNLVAVVGNDFPGEYWQLFKDRKVDLTGLSVKPGKTFSWEGEYGWDFNDPKTIATHLNVFADFNPRIPREYKNSEYLFLANIDPQIQAAVLKQLTKPKLVVCDTMNYWIENKRNQLLRLLKKVDIFLLNESEAKQLTGENNLIKMAKAIIKLGPKIAIIKRGENGVLLFSGNSVFCIPAFLLESVFDPTGAGDTFAGGLIGYLSKCETFNEANLKKAIAYGSIMATFAVESFSLDKLKSIRNRDIERRYKKFKQQMSF